MSTHTDSNDAIHPAFASFLATLVVIGLGSLLYLGSSWYAPLLDIRRGLFANGGWMLVGPIAAGLSGLLAAPIYLLERLAPRPGTWKCGVWVYTWLLLADFGWVTKTQGFGKALLQVIGLMPYVFPLHAYVVVLAVVGAILGEVLTGLWLGWLTWPKGSWLWKIGAVLAVLVCLLQRCH